jgi:hypothetical protein
MRREKCGILRIVADCAGVVWTHNYSSRRAMQRQTIGAAQLYAVLDREFRRLRSPECRVCRIPLPFRQDAPDEVSANWRFGTPTVCPHGCHVVMAELLADLWTRYDLDDDRR